MAEFTKTNDIVTDELMRQVYGSRVDDECRVIKVHVGEWRAEGSVWRLYRDPEIRRQ